MKVFLFAQPLQAVHNPAWKTCHVNLTVMEHGKEFGRSHDTTFPTPINHVTLFLYVIHPFQRGALHFK